MPAPSDLVHETTVGTGTGNLDLINVNGKRSFNTAFGNGAPTNVFDYFISHRTAAEWERGTGHMSDSDTLVRDTVIASSNSNNAVNFSAGTKDVTNDVPAGRRLLFDATTALTPTQQAQAQQNLGILGPFGGRLTLTSATPVLSSNAVGATTVYYSFFRHDKVPVYDGTSWRFVTFTELSLALDSDSGHTGYHQSGKLFDIFYAYVSGTLYFGTGPAWTNNTTRSAAISRLNGIWTNTASMTLRHGSSSGNTVTVPANQGAYLGTMYATANGQTGMNFLPSPANGGTNNILGLYNAHNRVPVNAICFDNTSSWTYNSSSGRPSNDSASNRVSFVDGLQESSIITKVSQELGAGVGVTIFTGIGLDTTVSPSRGALIIAATATVAVEDAYAPVLGFHFISGIEATSGGSGTFYGLTSFGGVQSFGLQVSLSM